MLYSTFIIKVGERHYGYGFHVNLTEPDYWPDRFLTTNINQAEEFNNIYAAKDMAANLYTILKNWIKITHQPPYEWEPISVVELVYDKGSIVETKPFVMEELNND